MFPSALAAVQAAVAMQQELAAQDVPVRIGIHVGEVIVEPERLTGEAVNIASRIESFARAGRRDALRRRVRPLQNRSDVEVVALGRFKLKNVGRPFELYAVAAGGLVVPDPAVLEGKGERFASLPSNLPEPTAPLRRPGRGSRGALGARRESTGSSPSPARAASARPASSPSSAGCSRPSSSTAWRSWRWPRSRSPADFVPASRRPSTSRRPRGGRSPRGSSRSSATGGRSCCWTTSSRSWRPPPTWRGSSSAARSCASSRPPGRRCGSPREREYPARPARREPSLRASSSSSAAARRSRHSS